jgi:hypothetical protein
MLGHRFVQGYAFDQIKLALSGRLHERAHGRLVACFSAQLRGIDALHGPCAVHPLSTGSAAPVIEAAASVANPPSQATPCPQAHVGSRMLSGLIAMVMAALLFGVLRVSVP